MRKDEIKRILFLTVSGRHGASSRYRVYQYIPFLEDAGYAVKVVPPGNKGRGAGRLLRGLTEGYTCIKAAGDSDIVFIQKRLFSRSLLKKFKKLGKKVVFDFDDSIFTSPKDDWSRPTRKKVLARLGMTFEMSDLVIAGNGFLGDYAVAAGARRVEVIPTVLDITRYPLKEHTHQERIVLGWIGSSVNHGYLKMLEGALAGLSREHSGLELLVVSDNDFNMSGVRVINKRWSEETETEELMKMDIGLMPLADNEWTRGKCALKALQYMACGIPAVCSSVGANKEVIEDGVDGLLAGNAEEWSSALKGLISSPEKRAALGLAGRRKVEREYDISVLAPRYAELLEGAP